MEDDLLQKYPFLNGVEDAEFIIEVLKMPLSDEEMSRKMQGLLSAEQFEQYKQWKQMGELLNMISDIDIRDTVRDILVMEATISQKAAMIGDLDEAAYHAYVRLMPNEEDFLQLLSAPLRAMIEKKLKEGNLDVVEKLISSNGVALWQFLQWKKRSQALSKVPVPVVTKPSIPPKKPALPGLSHRIKVPADRVVGVKWLLLFNRLRKTENYQCDVFTTNDNGTQVINLKGDPSKVLDAALEIWRIMAKEMAYSEYLAPWLADMVSRIWDRPKRLSFLQKQLVELWIGEENGFKFVRLNAWTYDELQTAKGQLSEEYKKIPAKKIQPVIQVDTSKQVSSPIKPAKNPYPNEINILVLGQSGVGKSTFINSVANYLIHKTMGESLQGDLKILINFYASMTDDTGREQDVLIESTVGDKTSENERFGVGFQGLSVTQKPKSYLLECRIGGSRHLIRFTSFDQFKAISAKSGGSSLQKEELQPA